MHAPLSLLELLELRVASTPDAPALLFDDVGYSYAEFDRVTGECAGALAALGVTPGKTVGIMMANHADYVVTWWAIARAGGLEVPVNVAYKGALLRYILDHADIELLVADVSFLDVVAAVAPSLPRLRLVVVRGDGAQPPGLGVDTIRFDELFDGAGAPSVEPKPWDPAAIMYTSGTTGPSKGVVLPHNYFVNMGAVNAEQRDVRTTDVLYTCLPLFHGNAQLLTFMTGVVSGAPVALGARFSVSGFWPDVRRYGATQFNYIGTILTLLLKGEAEAAEEGHRLRLGWGAGATAEVWQRFEERFGIRVSEAYGMTENGMVLYSPPDAPRPGSCGKPIAMADVIVADDDDEPVAPGTVGQLLTRPRRPFTMMLGYHKMPEQTLSSFRNSGSTRGTPPTPTPTATSSSSIASRMRSAAAARTSRASRWSRS